MQDKESLFTGEQGVAYIPMPKGSGFTPRLVTASSSDRRRECSASMTGNADGVPTAAAMIFGICSGSSHCRMFVFNGGKVTLGAFMPFSPNTDTTKRKAFLSVLGEHRSASSLHTACQREIYFFVLHRK